MVRPLEFDREAAIELAMNEIWLNGYEGTSVKALCEKLKITRSSFYNAFGNREKLFKLALERYLEQVPERALAAMTPKTPLKPTLTRVFREICRVRANDPASRGCMAVNSMNELLPGDSEPGTVIASVANSAIDRLEELVQWAKDRSELPDSTDARGLALAIHSIMLGISTQSKLISDEKELWKSASTGLNALGLYSPI